MVMLIPKPNLVYTKKKKKNLLTQTYFYTLQIKTTSFNKDM